MAAPRAYWKGHIRLALVSFPVRLYAAVTQTERIALHRIHRDTHERIRMQNVVPGDGPVERDDVVMGYEYQRDKYIPVEEDELDALDVESKHTIDLSHFVDLSDIDPIYFDKPYFMAPDGDIATEAFVTIRDALRHAKKVALGQIVLSRRERIVAIQPCGKGLLMEALRWADEVREADAYFDDIANVKVSSDQVEMAESLIKARAGAFEPEKFVDSYQEALRALINQKLKGKEAAPAEPERKAKGSNVINLMDALKASLDDDKGGKSSARTRTSRAASGSGTVKKSRAAPAKAKTTRTTAKSSGGRQKKSA
ncbi:Ku protein [Acuticoccus kandeliae]|uniref:non-homologous end joining protein Ku n=1 Tax=Acuticoccus kandeliae TaxID=2073160 RepID=UPI000D3E09D2|nr:Ku protein [Acuticoccus kandeliae]